MVFDFRDIRSIFKLVEELDEFSELVAVGPGDAADFLEEGQGDLVVLLDKHFYFTLRARILARGVALTPEVLFVSTIPRAHS